jgi:hypothetical protein
MDQVSSNATALVESGAARCNVLCEGRGIPPSHLRPMPPNPALSAHAGRGGGGGPQVHQQAILATSGQGSLGERQSRQHVISPSGTSAPPRTTYNELRKHSGT